MIELVEDKLDIDTYLELRQSVNFRKLTRDQAKKGLSNSMYTLVAFKDGKAVGMGRIVGDGAIICYVQDLIIRPEVQGEGIGGLILETLKKFVIQEGYEGTTMMFDLMCAKGREEFYKKHGFIARPIHFRGVCTVVSKLFNIVTPDRAYFGQKDAQQLAIIRRMVRDLNMDIEIVGCPIVREEDGLAKSSRNTYLNEEERKAALILSKAVFLGKKMVEDGETSAAAVKEAMIKKIESEPMAKIDYVEAVDGLSMQPVEEIKAPVLVAMAVYIGKTRLIDNFIVE